MPNDRKNLLQRISEGIYNVRLVPRPEPENNLSYTGTSGSLGKFIQQQGDGKVETSTLLNLNDLDEFRYLTTNKEEEYKVFDEMMADSEVSTVIEMYADEACQYNEDGKIIWAEADDPEVAAYVNGLLDRLRIQENCWDHIYQLVYLGDLYLETFDNLTYHRHRRDILTEPYKGNNNLIIQKRLEGLQKEEYIEQVPNPSNLYDLTYRGKTVGFIKIPDDLNNEGIINYIRRSQTEQEKIYIMDPSKYVHICLKDNNTRYPETFLLDYTDENREPATLELRVKRGRSILAGVYKAYQELKLMKDSLLLNRVNRSSRVRIIQVEVGDLPKNEKSLMLKRLKDKIEQKNLMDKQQRKYNSMAAPGPQDNIIYTTMTGGKGQVTMSDLGENLNVTGTADLEPFQSSFYGKLRVSKAALGADMDGSGLSNGGTLSQQDIIFSRYIRRIQTAYISGIETLVNMFIINKLGRNNYKQLGKYLGKFTIKMTNPSTEIEKDRDESFKNKTDSVKQFIDLFSDDLIYPETKKKIIKEFTKSMLNKQDIANLLEEDTFLEDQKQAEEEQANNEVFNDIDDDSGRFDEPSPEDEIFNEE